MASARLSFSIVKSGQSTAYRDPTPGSLLAILKGQFAVPQRMPSAEMGSSRLLPAGPWGEISYYFVYLEAADHVVARFSMPSTATRWSFPGVTLEWLRAFFEAAGAGRERVAVWLHHSSVVEEQGTLHVLPPPAHVEELSRAQRAVIYAELAKSALNEFHRDPVYIHGGSAEEFLASSDVAQAHKSWFARMCYRRGSSLCFSDIPALLARAQSHAEALRLFSLASRTRAIIARLRLNAGTNIAALAGYWSDERRQKDLPSMLRSLVANCPADGIDLLHILPKTARKLMNTYPPETLLKRGRLPDCHWSSLNFFNHEPRDYFLNSRLATYHLLECYEKVTTPYRYGDVLVFTDPQGDACHSCVYIAGDIVFTKNGDNEANPWIMAQIKDLESIYVEGKGNTIGAYRKRPDSHGK